MPERSGFFMARMVQGKSKSGKVVRMPAKVFDAVYVMKRRGGKDPEKVVNLPLVDREEAKAQAMTPRHTIVKVREKNRARFTQLINENVEYLVERRYLSTAELGFLSVLATAVEMHSNALVERIPDDEGEGYVSTGQYLTVTQIARKAGCSVRWANRMVNELIRKGILYELVDTESLKAHGRAVEERPLFMNPEIFFAGDKNRINATLCRIVLNADHLERKGMKLPWKLWLKEDAEYGRLYRRKTYLKYREQAREKTRVKRSAKKGRKNAKPESQK